MCGIFAWYDANKALDTAMAVEALRLQHHRGPDYSDLLYFNCEGKICSPHSNSETNGVMAKPQQPVSLALGHNRLSIIDRSSKAHQPFKSGDGQYSLVFNGEIYNHPELRKQLEKKNYHFTTTCDTEVLFYSLIEWGVDAIEKLNGMWAFVFVDLICRKLIISRDRYGKKPLFYHLDKHRLICGSEPKSIFHILGNPTRSVDPNYLWKYVSENLWMINDDPKTLYTDISSLQNGETVIYSLDTQTIERKFDHEIAKPTDASRDDFNLKSDLQSAVNLRLRADVPVAVLVSGGIDSTTVAANAVLANNADNITFYTGCTGYGNDLQYSEMLAKALGIHLKQIDIPYGEDILSLIKKMTWHYELPIQYQGNSIAMSVMYQQMSEDGIRVVLDGTGGDEVFGGYYNFFSHAVINTLLKEQRYRDYVRFSLDCLKYDHLSLKKIYNDTYRYLIKSNSKSNLANTPSNKFFPYVHSHLKPVIELYQEPASVEFDHHDSLKQSQLKFIQTGKFTNWLIMNDRNSMMNSIEARNPLLDYRLAKYINFDANQKFYNGFNKFALRQALPDSVPDAIRWRRDKQGFRWKGKALLRNNERDIIDSIRASSLLMELFDLDRILNDRKTGAIKPYSPSFLRLYSVALLNETFPCQLS